ncbi:Sgf11, transcriptional regulation [Ascosphaera apis ARSEF 7405]|uniref:SAGA-associated factor 11 n=1 Tax=Ascosphaera apis ARSEF 7405 TaxID=392613 RepID=A0A162IN59_9EURO|nr:Sgf11, transcriptional regulation [Ascosphaera apis ARSEF 7405]
MEDNVDFSSDSTVAKITQTILDDVIYNIIHDVVAKVHREEKTARMRSAVTIARMRAEKEEASQQQNAEGEGSPASPTPHDIRVETEGAIYENGKVYLRGNPLSTTRETFCPHCRLPRLLYPPFGLGSRPLPDPNKKYCRKVPPIVADGVDAQGVPFVTDKIQRKKKNPPPATNSAIPGAPSVHSSLNPTEAIGDKANSNAKAVPHHEPPTFPSVKCPNCPRYIVTTRMAQHLDRCMGIGGTRRGAGNRTKTPQIADNASVTSNASSTAGPTKESTGISNNLNVKPSPLKRSMHADDSDEGVPLKKKKTWTKKVKEPITSSGSNTSGTGKDDTRPGVPSKLKKAESSSSIAESNTTNGTASAGEKKKLKLTLKAGST